MAINCEDFIINKPGFFGGGGANHSGGDPEDIMPKVNAWIAKNGIKVINVESICRHGQHRLNAVDFFYGVRVWYEVA